MRRCAPGEDNGDGLAVGRIECCIPPTLLPRLWWLSGECTDTDGEYIWCGGIPWWCGTPIIFGPPTDGAPNGPGPPAPTCGAPKPGCRGWCGRVLFCSDNDRIFLTDCGEAAPNFGGPHKPDDDMLDEPNWHRLPSLVELVELIILKYYEILFI